MWSSNIKPQVIEHGKPGKYNEKIYVIDFFLSSFLVERHIYLNKRKWESRIAHIHSIFPHSISRYYSGISFSWYDLYYTSEDYEILLNLD